MEQVKAYKCSCGKVFLNEKSAKKCEDKDLADNKTKEEKKKSEKKKEEYRDFVRLNTKSISDFPKLCEEYIKKASNGELEIKFTDFGCLYFSSEYNSQDVISFQARYKDVKNNKDIWVVDYFSPHNRLESFKDFKIYSIKGTDHSTASTGHFYGSININDFPHLKEKYDKYIELVKKEKDFDIETNKAKSREHSYLIDMNDKDGYLKSLLMNHKYIQMLNFKILKSIEDRQNEILKSQECVKFSNYPKRDFEYDELNSLCYDLIKGNHS